MKKTEQYPLYFWLGPDAELVEVNEDDFGLRIEMERLANRKWRNVEVEDDTGGE